jgi:AbrB family looped-hinge helix DNA binding protein
MLVTVDKRGSVSLPAALRKELKLSPGSYLDLTVQPGGSIVLNPVAVYPTIKLSNEGLGKLAEARQSGVTELPDWLRAEMDDAQTDPE